MRNGFMPEAGTPLSDDEAVYAEHSTSDIAWHGLAGGLDHLKGFGAWFGESGPSARYQIATFSVLRGALVGGATASWVLASDDVDVRTGRSLAVAADRYRNQLKWLRGVEKYATDAALHAERVAYLEDRLAQVAALRETRQPKGKLITTTAIEEATAALWPGDADLATRISAIWQAGSGDAHALGWPMLTRQQTMTPVGDGRYLVGAPSLRDVADAYFAAYNFIAYGFDRLIELGT